jgi:hypothetical protein
MIWVGTYTKVELGIKEREERQKISDPSSRVGDIFDVLFLPLITNWRQNIKINVKVEATGKVEVEVTVQIKAEINAKVEVDIKFLAKVEVRSKPKWKFQVKSMSKL